MQLLKKLSTVFNTTSLPESFVAMEYVHYCVAAPLFIYFIWYTEEGSHVLS